MPACLGSLDYPTDECAVPALSLYFCTGPTCCKSVFFTELSLPILDSRLVVLVLHQPVLVFEPGCHAVESVRPDDDPVRKFSPASPGLSPPVYGLSLACSNMADFPVLGEDPSLAQASLTVWIQPLFQWMFLVLTKLDKLS
jgi:hypothetical protein